MRNFFSVLILSTLFLSGAVEIETLEVAGAADSSGEHSEQERQQIVRGLLDDFGPDFVVVDRVRYRMAPRVVVKNREGEILPAGLKELSRQALISVVLEGHLVSQIQIVSLPR